MLLRFLIFSLFLSPSVVFAENKICNAMLAGGEHHLLKDYTAENAQFTDDSKKVLSVVLAADPTTHDRLLVSGLHSSSKAEIIDPFQGKNYPGVTVTISESGAYACFTPPANFQAHPIVYDVAAAKFHHLKEFAGAVDLAFSKGMIFARLADGSLGVYDLESKHVTRLALFKGEWQAQSLGNSDLVLVLPTRGYPRLVNLKSLEVKIIEVPFQVASVQSALEGSAVLLFGATDRAPYFYSVRDNRIEKLKIYHSQQIQLSANGQFVTYVKNEAASTLRVMNLSTGEESVMSETYGIGVSTALSHPWFLYRDLDASVHATQFGSRIKFGPPLDPRAKVLDFFFLDTSTAVSHQALIQYSLNGHFYYSLWTIESGEMKRYEIPFNSKPVFSKDESKILFYFPDPSVFKGGSNLVYDLKELSVASAAGRMPRGEVKDYFSALAEPGAFDLNEHSNAVFYFFESGAFKEHKTLAQKILLNVLSKSMGMYESLIARYPEFSEEGYFFKEHKETDVDARWMRGIKGYLDYFLMARTNVDSVVGSLKYLKAIHNYLGDLPNGLMNDCISTVVEAMGDAASVGEFKGVLNSMLYKFNEEVVYPMFWIPYHSVSDILFVRKAGGILEPVILGSAPIDGDPSTKTVFGFYAKHLPSLQVAADEPKGTMVMNHKNITWTHEGKRFKAVTDIEVVANSVNSILPHDQGPNYKQLLANGKLTGVVMITANLSMEAEDTIKAYESVFKSFGYTWEEHSSRTNDLKSWIKNMITSGEMDYFIKEGHSDGAERDAFRVYNHAKIMKASRMMKSGIREELYLAFPTDKSVNYVDPTKTSLFSNEEKGQAIRARIQAGYGELIDFNTSCWSVTKAVNEIPAIATKGEVEIASTTPVSMFRVDPNNAEYQILKDFLAGKVFRQMRIDMRRNADYVHKTGNTFIFSDDPDYQKLIRDLLIPPMDIRVHLTEEGKDYSSDE